MRERLRRTAAGLAVVPLLLLAACGGTEQVGEAAAGTQGDGMNGDVLDDPYVVPEVTLTDTDGAPYDLVTDTDDPLTLVFFGFTNCPDICNVVLSSRLIEGQFPSWRQLIPESFEHEVRLPRTELLEVSRRISQLAQRNAPLRFAFAEGELTVAAETPEVGDAREAIPAPYSGEPLEIEVVASDPAYAGGRVDLVWRGEPVASAKVEGAEPVRFTRWATADGYLRVHAFAATGAPLAVTNPVFVTLSGK